MQNHTQTHTQTHIQIAKRLPAVSKMLSAVGCQARMPTLLLWPSRVTVASVIGAVSPPSGMCHIYHQCNTKRLSATFTQQIKET